MRLCDGTFRQRAGFALFLGTYLLAVLTTSVHVAGHIGKPMSGIATEMGFPYIGPYGMAGAESGLCWGAELLAVNGVDLNPDTVPRIDYDTLPPFKTEIGAVNTLRYVGRDGTVTEAAVPVTPFRVIDAIGSNGFPYALGLMFMVLGVMSFLLRPYEPGSWGLLSFSTVFAAFVTLIFRPFTYTAIGESYFHLIMAVFIVTPLHVALTVPVPHRWYVRRRWLLPAVYALALPFAGLLHLNHLGVVPRQTVDAILSAAMVITMGIVVGRMFLLATRSPDALVAQSARVILVGLVCGCVPPTLIWFVQSTFRVLLMDMRIVLSTTIMFPIALAYSLVKHELFSARIVVRRSVVYALAAGVVVAATLLTATAVMLVVGRTSGYAPWVSPVVMALILLPVLHLWPRVDANLNAWLYPKRARFPELLRELGDQLVTCTSTEAILGVLAGAPARVGDATSGIAFLLPGQSGEIAPVCTRGVATPPDIAELEHNPVIQMLVASRQEIHSESIAVEPQFANVRQEAAECMRDLHAAVLLPIIRDNRVIGGVSVGPRDSGDIYEPAELNVLTMLSQQAVQAIARTEMFAALQAKQQDIADLKRVFPAQVVDQVIESGGAAEFPSRRKVMTVFFSDLRGFTAFSDTVEPEEVMATLAEYHRAMGLRVEQFGGTLERFVGDGMMVFFNDPVDQEDHVQRAVRMALAMRNDGAQLRENWERKGYHLDVGMGIHTGYATVGFVGYEGRRDYSVIGNVTNLSARLCDAAAGGEILVTGRVISELGTAFPYEPVGELTLKGFHQPQLTFRLLGVETHV